MSSRTLRHPLRAVLALSLLQLIITACDQWAVFVNSDGVLSISIVSDGFGRDRFRVRLRQPDGITRLLDVPASGRMMLGGSSAGPVQLTLLAPENCRVADPNPRTVSVGAGESVTVAFDVDCGG